MMRSAPYLLVLLVAVAGVAMWSDSLADHAEVTISIRDGANQLGCEQYDACYSPSAVSLDAGGEVIWSNDDSVTHVIASGTPENGDTRFAQATLEPGQTYSLRLHDPGTYPFYDPDHPWMTGMITVQGGAADDHHDGDGQPVSPLHGTVVVGALHAITGELSDIGGEARVGAKLAVSDFNEYLEEQGAGWRLEIVEEDTATDPDTALEKIESLHQRGIGILLGPPASASAVNIKEYADSQGLLLLSCCSAAPSLSIADDSIYRLVPDSANQAIALGKLLELNGIEVLVPIWRGDAYGDGMRAAVAEIFEAAGGVVSNGVQYGDGPSPSMTVPLDGDVGADTTDAPDLPAYHNEAGLLAEHVREAVDRHGANKVAVLAVSFDEMTEIVLAASQHDILDDILWFGSGSLANAPYLVEGEAISDFMGTVNFTTASSMVSPGYRFDNVTDRALEIIGRTPNLFTYSAYDSVWLVGKSIMEAGSTEPAAVREVLPEVAASYSGAMSSTQLDEAGDLLLANYRIWTIVNGTWVETGKYSAERDLLVAAVQPTGEVRIGALYPVTGSTKGAENREAALLGARDFNAFLSSINVDWRLSIIPEDTISNPFTALVKAREMHQDGIDIIIGPQLSINVERVGRYVNQNSMMLLSCCSTAPSLAVPGDGIFRLIPDDSKQGVAVGRLLESAGIKAMVSIWRGDVYGDGLRAATAESFESRGGIVGDGVRYGIAETDFTEEVAALADEVRAMVNEYGVDKVAVFAASFGEGAKKIAETSSTVDILTDVRWFGSEALAKTPVLTEEALLDLAHSVRFTALQVADNPGYSYERVHQHISDTFGQEPTSHVYRSYDAVWLVGLSILHTGMADATAVKSVFHDVASGYNGAQDSTVLNEAGDLASADYAVWQVVDGEWKEIGRYSLLDDSLAIHDHGQSSGDHEVDRDP